MDSTSKIVFDKLKVYERADYRLLIYNTNMYAIDL
jgi:hypothetical protein